jgi:hypothetical protein
MINYQIENSNSSAALENVKKKIQIVREGALSALSKPQVQRICEIMERSCIKDV